MAVTGMLFAGYCAYKLPQISNPLLTMILELAFCILYTFTKPSLELANGAPAANVVPSALNATDVPKWSFAADPSK